MNKHTASQKSKSLYVTGLHLNYHLSTYVYCARSTRMLDIPPKKKTQKETRKR